MIRWPRPPRFVRKTSMRWRLVQVVFALSGACALAYEVVWGRLLVTVLGGSALATSAVLTAYMGGLGLGSWAFGRWSRQSPSPLRTYAFVELGIGLLALALAPAIGWIVGLPAAARLALSLLVLALPTTLMGGTVPLVMAWSEAQELPPGKTLGRLYGLNTLGAALGCIVAGFVLIPKLGLELTNLSAVAGNLCLGLVVLAIHSRERGAKSPRNQPPADVLADDAPPETPRAILHFFAFASGMATLGLEVLWIRLLRITLGSTTYVFTLVVTTYVLGIGLGGLWSGRVVEGVRVYPRLASLQLVLVALLQLQFALLPRTPALFVALRAALPGWNGALWGSASLCAIVLFPATIVCGMTFPLLGRLFLRRGHRGRETGIFYAVNTLGAVVGALATTLVLVPAIGSARSFTLLALLPTLSLVLFVRADRARMPRHVAPAAIAVIVVAVALGLARPGWTPRYLAHGAYLPPRAEQVETLVFEEGRSSTVLVEKFGAELGMAVDGKPEASTAYVDRANQVLLGRLPALLVPRVNRALVIGLGSGMTLGMLSAFHPQRLELVELEDRMRRAAEQFGAWNHDVMTLPGFRRGSEAEPGPNKIIVDDGLNYLLSTHDTYDVITSDPIQPFFRGAAGLYTVEFFSRAKARLTADGAMAHWLPLANMSLADFRMIVRTFATVFPYARLYWTGGFADTILVGRTTPWTTPAIDAGAFERARADMESIRIDSAAQMEALLIADRDRLLAWAGPGRVNELDRPELEFSAPRSVFENTIDRNMSELLAMRRGASGSTERRVADVVLAYRALLEHIDDRDYADETMVRALGCATLTAECPALAASGVARRILFERLIGRGDREMARWVGEQATRGAWWPIRSAAGDAAPEGVDPHLARALDAFEAAGRLAVARLPDEAPTIAERATGMQGLFAPGSPEATRAAAIRSPAK